MHLINQITDSDFIGGTPEFMDRVTRYGARGVLVDDQLHVAMMYMAKHNLYKLPGGGVEENEPAEVAFLREIKEETGYEAVIIHELGIIEEHKLRNDFMQLSYCYIARAQHEARQVTLSENEKQLGMRVKWMPLEQALALMNDSMTHCTDYSFKFMILRDKTILEQSVDLLSLKR
ncbi:NUDIX hydrolase [Paenibacillus cremeus]|uniref:NUDIX domain-containing protein n=1 Tax=Paenibacillus cremeus TaxID=2163881 RepID=A0A559KGQ5_9BACL|nr:NUDIX domain-containing protein [Paenibacillus cremeus]TVY11317.1 NUDIX domain-containing protein [Paenibacillus cremeus]